MVGQYPKIVEFCKYGVLDAMVDKGLVPQAK